MLFFRHLTSLWLIRGLLGVWLRSSSSICRGGKRVPVYGLIGCVRSYGLYGVSGIIGLLEGGKRNLVKFGLLFAIMFICVFQFRSPFKLLYRHFFCIVGVPFCRWASFLVGLIFFVCSCLYSFFLFFFFSLVVSIKK